MAYELRIERESSEYPTLITDVNDLVDFANARGCGAWPTISLPAREMPGLDTPYMPMIGWQWHLGRVGGTEVGEGGE